MQYFSAVLLVVFAKSNKFASVLRINAMEKRNIIAKRSRLDVIRQIISDQRVACQEELLDLLADSGYKVTQGTLSRDLKILKVAKVASSAGKSYYILPDNPMYKRVRDNAVVVEAAHKDGFVSLRFTGNLAVLKTLPGYASRMAYDIDQANFDFVVGTIAGDDTIMIALEEKVRKEAVRKELGKVIKM